MADSFDDDFADRQPPRPRRSDGRASDARSSGTTRRATGQKQGMSGWMIAGIVALCSVPVFCCVIGILGSLLLPAVQQARSAARMAQSQNHLKQIGLAAHNFHSQHKAFPPHTAGGENLGRETDPANPRMSWLTASLPYLDRGDLWQQVDPAVAFDDPAAVGLYGTRVPVFLSPSVEVPGGGLAPAHFAGNALVLGEGQNAGFGMLIDGPSNTLLAGEVDGVNGAPTAWGDPDNLRDTAAGLNVPGGFGGNSPTGAVIMLLGDGSVRALSADIDPAVLRALGTPDGGETIGAF